MHGCYIRLRLVRIQEISPISRSLFRRHWVAGVQCLAPSSDTKLQFLSDFKSDNFLRKFLDGHIILFFKFIPLLSPPIVLLYCDPLPNTCFELKFLYKSPTHQNFIKRASKLQNFISITYIQDGVNNFVSCYFGTTNIIIRHYKNQILVNIDSNMTSRFFYSSMKEYFAKYRTKTREKRINFMNYLRVQRQKIIEREREKLFKRVAFWGIFLGGSFLIYQEIYRKKVEISKMNSKLQNFYSSIMVKQSLKQSVSCITLCPKTIDELSNIVSLAYRYHFKVIVRMDEVTKRQKIIISQKFDNKGLFLNLSALNKVTIDEINNTIYVQSGATCKLVNDLLDQKGFAPLFPVEFQKETIYDVITNNLPLNNCQLSKQTISMELLSSSGKNFRSAGETNRYGQIPSLNPLFIGTGGVFAIPTAANIQITKKEMQPRLQENIKIEISDLSQKILALRNFNEVNKEYIELQVTNSFDQSSQKNEMFVTCKERFPIFQEKLDICSKISSQKGIPSQKIDGTPHKIPFNMFFSANNKIFQDFLLRFGSEHSYQYKNGLLKVALNDSEDHERYISVINEITNNNGTLVWCDIPQILLRIKPSTDSSEVGAELMRKIVEVREGLDRRNVLYSHNRYEQYFAKGLFRRLTEYFW